MKKIVASVGLVALGASGLSTVYGQDVATPPYKPWNVSAGLRGFYDDNPNTAPSSSSLKKGSYGYQLNPGFSLNWEDAQTKASLEFLYTLRWYENRPFESSRYDQDYQFNAALTHAFSERYSVDTRDSFVIGQEADLLRTPIFGGAQADFQRQSGNNVRNFGSIDLNGQLTPLFGFQLGFANQLFDYANKGAYVNTNLFGFPVVGKGTTITNFVQGPSTAGSLNRNTSTFHLDARWQLLPETVGILGYRFDYTVYTGDEPIAVVTRKQGTNNVLTTLMSDSRNARANYIYVGADQNFSPDLSGSIRVGVSDTDYYNDSTSGNTVSPYVTASLKYIYTVESYVEGGLSYDRSPTSVVSASKSSVTTDAETFVVFGHVNHRLLPKVYADILAQMQDSVFHGGSADGQSQQYYTLGLNLQYRFNPYLSADAGYNYDRLNSDLAGMGYSRNRVYIGLTAKY